MPTPLRLRPDGLQWPYSIAQLRIDEPQLSISAAPHAGEIASWLELEPPIVFILPSPTDPPEHNPATHRPQEVRPVQAPDGAWLQAWQLVPIPPPPVPEPLPDWDTFRRALREENGFMEAFQAVLSADSMAGIQLAISLNEFRKTGEYADFLETLVNALAALPDQEAGHQSLELLALAGRCNLPTAFLNALQALFPEPAP